MGWLEVRPTWKQYFQIIGTIFVFEIFLVTIQHYLVLWLNVPTPKMDAEFEKFIDEMLKAPVAKSGAVFVLVAWLEEFVFRLVPLFTAMFLFGWFKVGRPIITLVLFATAASFGLAHLANFDLANQSWLVSAIVVTLVLVNQGLGGFLYGALFLKYCGLTHFKYSWGAFYTVVIMHWAWDTGIIVVSKIFG